MTFSGLDVKVPIWQIPIYILIISYRRDIEFIVLTDLFSNAKLDALDDKGEVKNKM